MQEQNNEMPAPDTTPSAAGGKPKVVETYAGDMAKEIESGSGGMIKSIIHGEEEIEERKLNASPLSKKNRLFTSLGIVFTFLTLAMVAYFVFRGDTSTVPVETPFVPPIFNDANNFLEVKDLDKDAIAKSFLGAVNATKVKIGGVEGIYLTENKKVIGFKRFLALIQGNYVVGRASDGTSLVKDYFLMGAVNNGSRDETESLQLPNFFILLKVRSTIDVFDSFRAWERKMFLDLHGFFGVDITPESRYLLDTSFTDGIIENKNARILSDKDGKIVMMYIFADDNTVIITNTENATYEIIRRLAGNQITK